MPTDETLQNGERGYDAYGLEISKELISLADRNLQPYIQHGDMTCLKSLYKKESFGGIMSSASIVHMDHNIGVSVLRNCYNILKHGGIFYLSLKVHSKRKIEYKESISTPGTEKKYVYFGEKEIEKILQNMGFTILRTHTWRPGQDAWKILIAQK